MEINDEIKFKKFQKAEYKGRRLFKNILKNDFKIKNYRLLFSPNPFDSKDCIIYTDDIIYLTEIKFRYQSSKTYYQDIIEYQKFDDLLRQKQDFEKIYNKKVVILYFILYHNDATYKVYNLDLKEFIDETRQRDLYMNRTTSKKSNKILTKIIYLYPFDNHRKKSFLYYKNKNKNQIPRKYRI